MYMTLYKEGSHNIQLIIQCMYTYVHTYMYYNVQLYIVLCTIAWRVFEQLLINNMCPMASKSFYRK